MECHNCLPSIPAGAMVIRRGTNWHRIVYRKEGYVYKLVKGSINSGLVRRVQSIAAAHPDICEPFEYDEQTHVIRQRDLGDAPPTCEEQLKIHQAIRDRRICINDTHTGNIRGGKLIDFDIFAERHSFWTRDVPNGVTIQRTKRGGVSVTICHATPEEIEAAGAAEMIRKPN